jgi:type IV fimbrial biogenesis protein FimT
MDQSSARPARIAGFTLLEVMIALAIVGVLVGVGVPSFREALLNVRISAQANDLMSDLSVARSEAVKRNLPVFLCPSKAGTSCDGAAWSDGWMLYVDENNDTVFSAADLILKSRRATEGNNSIVATVADKNVLAVSYRPTGLIGGGAAASFVICDSRTTPLAGRNIEITTTGRPRVEKYTCGTTPP